MKPNSSLYQTKQEYAIWHSKTSSACKRNALDQNICSHKVSLSWKCLQSAFIQKKSSFVVSKCFSILRKTLLLPFFWGRCYTRNQISSGFPSYFSLPISVSLQSIDQGSLFILFFFFLSKGIDLWNSSYLEFSVIENKIALHFSFILSNSETWECCDDQQEDYSAFVPICWYIISYSHFHLL